MSPSRSRQDPRSIEPGSATSGTETPKYAAPRPSVWATKLRLTIARFPSPEICLQLVEDFLHIDVMFRTVAAPVHRRRMAYLVTYFPRCEEQHVPLLVLLASSMIIGLSYCDEARKATLPITRDELWSINNDLMQLMDNPRSYPEQHQLDFVQAHLLLTYAQSIGPGTSLASGWLAQGRLYHAALLVGLPKPHDESLYLQECRRRIWWGHVNHKR